MLLPCHVSNPPIIGKTLQGAGAQQRQGRFHRPRGRRPGLRKGEGSEGSGSPDEDSADREGLERFGESDIRVRFDIVSTMVLGDSRDFLNSTATLSPPCSGLRRTPATRLPGGRFHADNRTNRSKFLAPCEQRLQHVQGGARPRGPSSASRRPIPPSPRRVAHQHPYDIVSQLVTGSEKTLPRHR